MTYLDIMLLIGCCLIAIGILIALNRIKNKEKVFDNRKYDMVGNMVILVILITVVFAFTGLVALICYGHVVSLPYQYDATCQAIEELETYLMKYDNINTSSEMGLESLGWGLESSELKQRLADLIETKYDKYQGMITWIKNPWNPYSDVMKHHMREVGVKV